MAAAEPLIPASFSFNCLPCMNRSNCKKATVPPVLMLSSMRLMDLGIKSSGSEMWLLT